MFRFIDFTNWEMAFKEASPYPNKRATRILSRRRYGIFFSASAKRDSVRSSGKTIGSAGVDAG